jgi:putative ATP-dependent endonuclease of OLD family
MLMLGCTGTGLGGGQMKIFEVAVENFRGIKSAKLKFPDHGVLIGDNNTGKSTIFEAIDLALGPDRLSKRPPVDEHDFYMGKYLPQIDGNAAASAPLGVGPKIRVDVTVTNLSEEQRIKFGGSVEWLDSHTGQFYQAAAPGGIDAAHILAALRVTFLGEYDPEEDDFAGNTYFTRSLSEEDDPILFSKNDKRYCGFLFLRSIRTGSRALSLEHGSLLDIILRLKEIRPKMWEDTLHTLKDFDVASDPEIGISGVLESINKSLKKYVPREWGVKPHLKVSNLTREHLRKIITAFIASGEGEHAAPFYRQGTGTINMLVLAMLSQVAEDKQNVIFAMEEVETAIPPYAQKRIVHALRTLAAQSLFTSHSPYVLEEFSLDETIMLSRSADGMLTQFKLELPASVKHKRYRQEFRTRFCEGLLSRRILIAEGATEATSLPALARRLSELNPETYKSLEALGICVVDAGGESQIADLAALYKSLGKQVFALCDKQTDTAKAAIEAQVDRLFMHDEQNIEDLVCKSSELRALESFAAYVDWPPYLLAAHPNPSNNARAALKDYFSWSKGNWGMADFLSHCSEAATPVWLREVCVQMKAICDPEPPRAPGNAGR